MDVLIFIVVFTLLALMAIGVVGVASDILRPVTNWLSPEPPSVDPEVAEILEDINRIQARIKANEPKRIPRSSEPSTPDGMYAVRKLLKEQSRTPKT